MAIFTNQATLSYNNTITTSNIVTGEVLEVLSASKNSLSSQYRYDETITYVISINNTGVTAFNNLTLTDDLGTYTTGGLTVTPLTYETGTVSYYVNGVLQATPTVTAGPPLVISNINVPAGGNAVILYEARVNQYAPPEVGSTIVNNVVISGSGLTTPIEVTFYPSTLSIIPNIASTLAGFNKYPEGFNSSTASISFLSFSPVKNTTGTSFAASNCLIISNVILPSHSGIS